MPPAVFETAALGSTFWTALLLTSIAGLATVIGSLLATIYRSPSPRYLSGALGLSTGIMLHTAYVELLNEGFSRAGFVPANLAFAAGITIMVFIDMAIPHHYMAEPTRQHENNRKEDHAGVGQQGRAPWAGPPRWACAQQLRRTSTLIAVGIAIHNFPEGVATFAATLQDVRLGVSLALATAIHNIPEGIAVASPVYAMSGNIWKGFRWSLVSGAAEPLGAIIAAGFLLPILNPVIMGLILAAVAGVMVYIAFDELLPTARRYSSPHTAIVGVLAGIVIMTFALHYSH